MSFSFKPDIVDQGASAPAQPQAPQASFGAASTATMMTREVEHGKSFFQVVLSFIFGVALFIAAAMYAYTFYLSSEVETKKATLASYESRLATLPLEDMRKLSNRIKIINQLIKEHPSVNVAFKIVEDSVENQVTYKQFELRYNDQTKAYALQLRGVAPDYKGLAQQVDTLKRKPYTTYIPSVTVDSLQPDEVGKISFTLKMPITIAGLLPETINLSQGAADRIASSTSPSSVQLGQSTSTNPTSVGTTTVPKTGTTTVPSTTPPKR